MSKEFDIYGDLDSYSSEQKYKEKCSEIVILQEKYNSSIETLSDLQNENMEFRKRMRNIERSFWSLLETAKLEVSRKDKHISELRQKIDNITFRRPNPKIGDKCWVTKENIQNTSLHCGENIPDTKYFCGGNKTFNAPDTHQKNNSAKVSKLYEIVCQNNNIKNSEYLKTNEINETKNLDNAEKIESVKKIKISKENNKSKLLENINSIKKKVTNTERQIEATNSLNLIGKNFEYTAKNIEDLIFDEMLNEANSLNIKNYDIDINENEKIFSNEKFCKFSQINKISAESAFNRECSGNVDHTEDQKNIKSGIEQNIDDKIVKTFDKIELYEKNKTVVLVETEENINKTVPLVKFGENINENERQKKSKFAYVAENEITSNPKNFCHLSNDFGNKMHNSLQNNNPSENNDFKVSDKIKSCIENNSTQIKEVDLSDNLKSGIHETRASINIFGLNDTKTVKCTNEQNEGNFLYTKQNSIEQIYLKHDKKRNSKLPKEFLERCDQSDVKENLDKVNESTLAIKNKNDKFIGHKIDGFKPKNTEKQGKEACKLKQTLFQEVISGGNTIVDNLKINLPKTIQNSSKKLKSDDTHKSTAQFDTEIEAITTDELTKNHSNGLKNIPETIKPNSLEQGQKLGVGAHNKEEILNDNHETALILEKESTFVTKKIHLKQNEKMSPAKLEEESLEIKNIEKVSKNSLEPLNQYGPIEKNNSKISILENIQILPPKKDKIIHSPVQEKEKESNLKEEVKNSFSNQTFALVDVKPQILKPDVNKILPLLNNSVETNKAATDELVKILDDDFGEKRVPTPKKCNLNLKEKFLKDRKDETKSEKSILNDFKFSPNKPEIFEVAKNTSPNQSETLEAIKFLTDNLLEISNECNPSKELKNLSLETIKANNLVNETEKAESENYINKNKNKKIKSKKSFPVITRSTRKNPKDILKTENHNRFDKLKHEIPRKILSKRTDSKIFKEKRYMKKSPKKKKASVNKLFKNSKKKTKTLVHKSKTCNKNENYFCNKRNVTNRKANGTNKENSISLIDNSNNLPKTKSPTAIINDSAKNYSKAKIALIKLNISNSLPCETKNSCSTLENENNLDILQKEIDDIFGKSPFNDSIYVQNLSEIKENNDESMNLCKGFNSSGDSLNKLCTLNKTYEMEIDSDGIPIWNITKKRKKRLESGDLFDNNCFEKNYKKAKVDENFTLEHKVVCDEEDLSVKNGLLVNKITTISYNNQVSSTFEAEINSNDFIACKTKIDKFQKKFLASYKIPKVKKIIKDKETKEFFNTNTPVVVTSNDKIAECNLKNKLYEAALLEQCKFSGQLNNTSLVLSDNLENDTSSTKGHNEVLLKNSYHQQFKSPHQVEQDFKECENNIEKEFIRIFGKSPPRKQSLHKAEAQNNYNNDCIYNPERPDQLYIKIKDNQICDKSNKNSLNISTVNHNSNHIQKYFKTSTKTYEMQKDVNDGTINWIIKRKKEKRKSHID